MKSKKISVIIPVYNAEETLERCINSIVSETVDFEIICVDDGSKDGSWALMEKLAKTNSHIVPIHKENAGAGKARECGIMRATGDYIMFCDADDSYMTDTISNISKDIDVYNADYIVFHRIAEKTNGKSVLWGDGNEVRLLDTNWVGYLNDYMLQQSHGMGVTTKVYKKSIIDNYSIKFGDFLFGEDVWFNLNYIIHCKSFVEDYGTYYLQYVTEGSICQKSYNDFLDKNEECIKMFMKTYPKKSDVLKPFINRFLFSIYTRALQRIWLGIDTNKLRNKITMTKNLLNRDFEQNAVAFCISNNLLTGRLKYEAYIINTKSAYKYATQVFYKNKLKSILIKFLKK